MGEGAANKQTIQSNTPSGTTILHEVAIEIQDTDPSGAKSAQITYIVTGSP